MSSNRNRRHATTTRLLAAIAAFLTVLVPASAMAAGAKPGKVPVFSKKIEAAPQYVGQTVCSPTAKKGTLALQKWLMTRYAGTGSSGIVRGCATGGKSEHKEGRAFDWRVSVHSAKNRAQVKAFMKLAFATDKYGSKDAIARRMGIMYLIWDDTIYSASRGYQGVPYRNAGCPKKKKPVGLRRHPAPPQPRAHLAEPGPAPRARRRSGTARSAAPPPRPPPSPPSRPSPRRSRRSPPRSRRRRRCSTRRSGPS
ncbi:hypothetical protein GCM10025868_13190 [Angustibacter aerolatus]|uniref:ARB-07466-like C-terminal domain-containing protein n=1 Tax=Angustibacter aerolatus TaxID=1162965 RepID=A0ABQ6JE31_9ACTN|nr:hypothetical protein [Angustibacter aerolatus]GMA86069.1 hypothetical protein GCM10025868_13190 [Angustibacter aerolatus]